MCLYPRLIKNGKYTPTKKNGGVYTPPNEVKDKRVLSVPIGCGKCVECLKKKAREWRTRLGYELKKPNERPIFITLTFSNESYRELYFEEEIDTTYGYAEATSILGDVKEKRHKPRQIKFKLGKKIVKGYDRDNKIAKLAVRRWLERNRKKTGKSVKHWLVTELGHEGTENIHLHGIIWSNQSQEELQRSWSYGHIWCGEYVNERTINYIIKYVTKIDKDHKYYKPVVLTSAGIGGGYWNTEDGKGNKYKEEGNTKTYKRTESGHKIAIPIYWRNYIYTEEEKEKLWLEMLDKEVRYINGIKINIKKNPKLYYDMLKQAQIENIKDGYGTGDFNWEEKRYEEEQRILKQKERLTAPQYC